MRGEQNEQICIPSGSEESNSGTFLEAQAAGAWGKFLRNRKNPPKAFSYANLQADFSVSPFLDILFHPFWGEALGLLFPVDFLFQGRSPSFPFFLSPIWSFPFSAEHPIMEILPSVLTWLSGVVKCGEKEISDATTDTANFLDKKSYQVTGSSAEICFRLNRTPARRFLPRSFANPIRARENISNRAPGRHFLLQRIPILESPTCWSCSGIPPQRAKGRYLFDTGTWVNPKDGIWRQELDDSVMIINPAMINSSIPVGSPSYYLERVIEHNDLFKAAPI